MKTLFLLQTTVNDVVDCSTYSISTTVPQVRTVLAYKSKESVNRNEHERSIGQIFSEPVTTHQLQVTTPHKLNYF